MHGFPAIHEYLEMMTIEAKTPKYILMGLFSMVKLLECLRLEFLYQKYVGIFFWIHSGRKLFKKRTGVLSIIGIKQDNIVL